MIEVGLGNEPVGYTGLRLPKRQIPGTEHTMLQHYIVPRKYNKSLTGPNYYSTRRTKILQMPPPLPLLQ